MLLCQRASGKDTSSELGSPVGEFVEASWTMLEDSCPIWHSAIQEVDRLGRLIRQVDPRALANVERILIDARLNDACIFVAGNGGSSATASHWVNDLQKTSGSGRHRGVRAVALTDNTPLLTALANDDGYEWVFQRQLATHLRPGDVLVLISVSGSSPNLLRAAAFAADAGATTVGLLGWDGGVLAGMVTESIVVPAPRGEYPLVECAHLFLCDLLCASVAT
jgi:D-sedoheptulose 7-phosphate isomerase